MPLPILFGGLLLQLTLFPLALLRLSRGIFDQITIIIDAGPLRFAIRDIDAARVVEHVAAVAQTQRSASQCPQATK